MALLGLIENPGMDATSFDETASSRPLAGASRAPGMSDEYLSGALPNLGGCVQLPCRDRPDRSRRGRARQPC